MKRLFLFVLLSSAFFGFSQSNTPMEKLQSQIDSQSLAIPKAPNNPENYKHRAKAYLGIQELQKAKADFDKVLELTPNDAESYYFRGLCKISINNSGCEDLAYAKKLGYVTQWEDLKIVCGDL